MDYKNLAYIFVDKFEEYNAILQEHIVFHEEILNHIFFGECNKHLIKLLEKETNIEQIHGLFDFFELMAKVKMWKLEIYYKLLYWKISGRKIQF